ncbi:MAG TPA: hypothetical protein GXZ58_06345 [Bacilli bacterium]|nr:hypothetical protein [Bacilli bacterium]
MGSLSESMKEELLNALDNKNEMMFVSEGKLISLEVHDDTSTSELPDDLSQEINEYQELKESLQRYSDNPNMKRYTAKELKELRYEQRR